MKILNWVVPHQIHSAPKAASTALREECSPVAQCGVKIKEIQEFNVSATGSNKTSHIITSNSNLISHTHTHTQIRNQD